MGQDGWQLDSQGDAIHRTELLASRQAAEDAERSIMRIADDLNHHPHISHGDLVFAPTMQGPSFDCQMMTITSTTHYPRGLSSSDTKLAQAINEVLSDIRTIDSGELPVVATSQRTISGDSEFLRIQQKHLDKHRDEINRAVRSKGKPSTGSGDLSPS